MIKKASYITALVLILTAATLMAQADVQNLVMSRQNGETVLRIDLSQPGQAELAALPASSDKPFRVLVDISPARHRLPMQNFLDLPASVVTAIRTSQFAMEPSPVVRIVLDLAQKTPYRLETVNNSLFIYLTNADGQDFLTWSSAGVKVPVMAGKNNTRKDTADKSAGDFIKSSRPATEAKPNPSTKNSEPPATVPEKKKPIFGEAETSHKRQMTFIDDYKSESQSVEVAKPAATEEAFNDAEYGGLSPDPGNSETEVVESTPLPEVNVEEQIVTAPAMTAQDWLTWIYSRPQSSYDLEREVAVSRQPALIETEVSVAEYSEAAPEALAMPPVIEPSADVPVDAPVNVPVDVPVEEPQYASLEEPVVVPSSETPETTPATTVVPDESAFEPEPSFDISEPLVIAEPAPIAIMAPYHRPQRSTVEFDKPSAASMVPDVPVNETSPATAVADSHSLNAEPQVLADISGDMAVPPVATSSEISDSIADVDIYPESAADTLETAPTMADSIPLDEELAPGEKPTSRFRRQPMFPSKLKGTIVAEFPTRMVIAYTPGQNRDPFETLLNEKRSSNSPMEKRIPDIETSRLVGVLESADGEVRALLEDLDGYGYIVQSGDKVKKGYVDKIEADKAYFRLFEYGWSRTIALYLTHN